MPEADRNIRLRFLPENIERRPCVGGVAQKNTCNSRGVLDVFYKSYKKCKKVLYNAKAMKYNADIR